MATTNDTPTIENFADLKREFAKSFNTSMDKLADEYGLTRQELASRMINNVITCIMFGRAARKGNVAKTIYWGVVALQYSNRGSTDRKIRAQRREREELFKDMTPYS